MLAAAGFACSVNELGKIPCNDTRNCPSDYPTCSAAGFCVNSAPAARIDVVSGDAQTAMVGTALAQTLVVKVVDTNGNAVAGFSVTWAVGTGAGQVSAGSTTTGPDGKASITATVGTTAGGNAFTVSGAGVTGTTFTATGIAASAVTLAVTGFPNTVTAVTAGSVTVTARDTFGNTATGYLGTVQLTTNNTNSTLPLTHTFVAGDNGVFTFTGVVLKKAGPPSSTITATDTVTATIIGSQTGIVVNPGPTAKLLVTFPSPVSADTGGSVTVIAADANNNTTPGYLGTVQVTTDNPNSTLPMTHAFIAGNNGIFTFTGVVLKKASAPTYSITATDTPNSFTGSQTGIVVNPGATTKLLVTGFPNPVLSGTPGSVTVTAQDANNNTTPSYGGNVQLTSTNLNTNLPVTGMFTGPDAGVHTFTSVILNATSGGSSIDATDLATLSITGSQTGIVVNQGPLVFGATATLISGGSTRDGLIFIAGGSTDINFTSALPNTWLYNPANSSITTGPALTFARSLHTATAFGVGRVLIAGGSPGTLPAGFTEFELCDLNAPMPTCSPTGSAPPNPPVGRCNAAAAAASPTQVLIAGGDNCAAVTFKTWDLWDSATPTTTITDNGGAPPPSNQLTVGRRLLTATVVGTGKVLLAGGNTGSATADVFTLDSVTPANSTVAATAGLMADRRLGHSATLLTSCPSPATVPCVLIAGGNLTLGKTWEIYNASTNSFPLNTTTGTGLRQFHAAASFANGRVLLAGGSNGATPQSTTEFFDPTATPLGFTSGLGLQLARFRAAAAYAPAQNVLVLIGGNAVGPSTEQVVTP